MKWRMYLIILTAMFGLISCATPPQPESPKGPVTHQYDGPHFVSPDPTLWAPSVRWSLVRTATYGHGEYGEDPGSANNDTPDHILKLNDPSPSVAGIAAMSKDVPRFSLVVPRVRGSMLSFLDADWGSGPEFSLPGHATHALLKKKIWKTTGYKKVKVHGKTKRIAKKKLIRTIRHWVNLHKTPEELAAPTIDFCGPGPQGKGLNFPDYCTVDYFPYIGPALKSIPEKERPAFLAMLKRKTVLAAKAPPIGETMVADR